MQDCQFRIVVVGAGSAGYFAASALKYNHPNIDVVIVYDPAAPSIGVGESLTWYMPTFMREVMGQTDPLAWMTASKSTLKFGTMHLGFDGTDRPCFFALPDVGRQAGWLDPNLQNVHPDQWIKIWENLHHKGFEPSYNQVASSNFWHMMHNTLPISDENNMDIPHSPLHTYHLNSALTGPWVHSAIGQPAGVREEHGSVQSIKKDSNGNIDYLVLDSGVEVHGNLFIDCTGLAQVLAKAMDFEFEDYEQHWNNSAIVGPHRYLDHGERKNYTTVAAVDHGWRFSVPMDVRSGEGYVYNTRLLDVDIEQVISEHHSVTGYSDIKHKHLSWRPGHYRKAIDKNCVLLGLSHGFVDPFDANGFDITLTHIAILVRLLQQDSEHRLDWHDFYNNKVDTICRDIKFRIEVAMHLAPKNNTAYWQAMKEAGAQANTLERLLDALSNSDREPRSNPKFRDKFVFTRHTFVTQAHYYGILNRKVPYDQPDLQLENLAKMHFIQTQNQFDALAKASMPTAEFYRNIYPL